MAEHSLNWIITRNLVSGKYVFIQDFLFFLKYIQIQTNTTARFKNINYIQIRCVRW